MIENITNFVLGASRNDLKAEMKKLGENSYRVQQLWSWMYVKGVKNFEDMTDLSLAFRNKLKEKYVIYRPEISSTKISSDGTRKWLLRLSDKNLIEMVFIPESDRGTLCISSQIGCTLNCSFCHTGTMPIIRNLQVDEIVGQVLVANDELDNWPYKPKGKKITNIVFMGMGEPLYNYKNVIKSLKILQDSEGLAFSNRKITLSTSGIVPMIEKLKLDCNVNLAISLHAVSDDLRNTLVPINKKWPINTLLESLEDYPGMNNSRRITFEYIMLKNINDSEKDAKKLVKLLKHIPSKINLIPFNYWKGSVYESSDKSVIKHFSNVISKYSGITATIRHPRGSDILAACRQLKSESTKKRKQII